eukprot:m.465331 g.465331  ORF g.465331 m.465331 type:complete len:434 (+) comp24123_c0_seq1:249-1550(+)
MACNDGCIVGLAGFVLLCGVLIGFIWQYLRHQVASVDHRLAHTTNSGVEAPTDSAAPSLVRQTPAAEEKTYLSTPEPHAPPSRRESDSPQLGSGPQGSQRGSMHFYPHGSVSSVIDTQRAPAPPRPGIPDWEDVAPTTVSTRDDETAEDGGAAEFALKAAELRETYPVPSTVATTSAPQPTPATDDPLLKNRESMAKMRQSLRKISAVQAFRSTILADEGEAKITELESRIGSTQREMEETQRRIDEMLAREEALNAAAESMRAQVLSQQPAPRSITPVSPLPPSPSQPNEAADVARRPLSESDRGAEVSGASGAAVDDGSDPSPFSRNDSKRRSTSGYNPDRFAMLSRLFEKKRASELELAQMKVFAVRRAAAKWMALVERRRAERRAAEDEAKRLSLPPPLPVGWERHVDSDGRTYYSNAQLGKSQWTPPI